MDTTSTRLIIVFTALWFAVFTSASVCFCEEHNETEAAAMPDTTADPQTVVDTAHSAQRYLKQGDYHLKNEGNVQAAEEDYMNAIQADPSGDKAYYALALMYWYQMKDLKKAENIVEKGLEYNPHSARLHYFMALVNALQSNRTETERSLRNAIEADDTYLDAYVTLALFYAKTDRKREVIAVSKQILAMDPGNKSALKIMDKLRFDTAQVSEGFAIVHGIVINILGLVMMITMMIFLSKIAKNVFVKGFVILVFSLLALVMVMNMYTAWHEGGTKGMVNLGDAAIDALKRLPD